MRSPVAGCSRQPPTSWTEPPGLSPGLGREVTGLGGALVCVDAETCALRDAASTYLAGGQLDEHMEDPERHGGDSPPGRGW